VPISRQNPFLTCKAVARYTFALARLSCIILRYVDRLICTYSIRRLPFGSSSTQAVISTWCEYRHRSLFTCDSVRNRSKPCR